MKNQAKLIMMVAPSGSGKTTYLKSKYNMKHVVSADDIRREITGNVSDMSKDMIVWPMLFKRAAMLLHTEGICIIDATNVTKRTRKNTIFLIRTELNKIKSDTELIKVAIVLRVPIEIAKERVQKDLREGKDRSNVPMDVIDSMYAKFNKDFDSLATEFHEIIEVDNY